MGERGYGLIETMRVREGRIPLWSRHLARLERSLRELDLSTPSQDLVALVTPFAGTGDAVLRLEARGGRGGAPPARGGGARGRPERRGPPPPALDPPRRARPPRPPPAVSSQDH